MNPCYPLLAVSLLIGACAGPREPLVVKQFQLRDETTSRSDEPMVKMEKLRRLHGSVSMAERAEKLGQYYTFIWSDPEGVGQGDVELILQYQQGATGSRIKRLVRTFPASEEGGQVEFSVVGHDYRKNGRVMAWKATLQRGRRVIATRQSYLWQ
ncbi:hypothetical protein [Luteolibacter yonseiensis]|uniref:hypothetical protein n=1 Tax=Luteolibacter yonseiensis TaxID=1144680 RepID=UPI0031E84A92